MSSRHRLFRPILAVSIAGLPVVVLAADPATTPAAPATPDYVFKLGGDASYAFDTDLHDDGGSFSIFRTGGTLEIDHAFNPTTAMSLTLGGEWSHYFFRNIDAAPGDDGSDALDAYQFDVRPTFTHAFDAQWSGFAGFTVSAAGMSEAKFGDSLTYGAFAGVNYRLSPTVTIGGGVSVVTQLEDNAIFFPLLTANWQITPALSLGLDGLGARASYKIDDAWTVYVRGEYQYRQFRLDSHEVVSDGVLTDQAVPITLGVTYKLDDSLTMSAEAGVVAWRRLEFDNDSGDQVGADEADPAAFVSVQLKYAF